MSANTHFAAIARNAALNAALALANGGSIAFYSGTQPATADTALSGNTLLAQLALSATAFANAISGVATANAVTAAAAAATGTASFFRIYKSDNVTAVVDGSVGAAFVLSGTITVTNGSASVATGTSQVGIVKVGDTLQFSAQGATPYIVLSVSAGTITLTTNYTGTTSGAGTATDTVNSDCMIVTTALVASATVSVPSMTYSLAA